MENIVNLYETAFDAKKYLEIYYTNNTGSKYVKWFIEFLHKLFSEGKISGKNLLDVGSGPTIQSVISASAYVKEIYLSDISENCRSELEKWIHGNPEALDHSMQLKHVALLEGHKNYKQIEKRIRKAVKGVLPCNIMKENPLEPRKMKFDIVVSSLCAGVYPEKFFQAYKSIASLVRQGGYVVFQESVDCSVYKVGDVDFPVEKKDVATVRRAIEEANIKILEVAERRYEGKNGIPANATGYVQVFGVKL